MMYPPMLLPWHLAFWGLLLLAGAVALAASIITLRIPRRWLVILAGAALVVAVIAVALPHPAAPPGVQAAVAVLALAVSVTGGGPAVMLVLALASRGSVREGVHGGIVVEDAAYGGGGEVLRGGMVIGIFERVAATGAILAGFPEALAVIVAVKGVGRFTELDAAEARERFIIGTMVSLVWACVCGALARLAIG